MATTTAPRITVARIHDQEGDGRCSACDREGLRWVAELSDGTMVGLECAKRVLGYKPQPKSYTWLADYTPVATYMDGTAACTLYQHRTRNQTAWAQNGNLMGVGGARQDWQRWGWLAD